MASTATHSDVLDEARTELNEAIKLLENGQPSIILNNRVKEKIRFAITCINAKKGRLHHKG